MAEDQKQSAQRVSLAANQGAADATLNQQSAVATPETEAKFKTDFKATIRCLAELPEPNAPWAERLLESGKCIVSGKPSPRRVVLARSY